MEEGGGGGRGTGSAGGGRGQRAADRGYGETVWEVTANLEGVTPGRAGRREAFHARHRDLFTYDLPEEEVVLVTARLAAIGRLPARPAPLLPARAAATPMATRRAWNEGAWAEWPDWSFADLSLIHP